MKLFDWSSHRILSTFQAELEPEKDINIMIDIPVKGRISKRTKNTTTVEELVEQVSFTF